MILSESPVLRKREIAISFRCGALPDAHDPSRLIEGNAMFADTLRRAIEAAPRVKLAELSTTLWKAWGTGHLADVEAQSLSDLIAARKALPAAGKPTQRRVGSRPRSPASMERRRRWAASGHLPPQLAARFTMGEIAVLSVVAVEVRTKGSCRLHNAHLAALAGVSVTVAKNAIREARELGLLHVQERRLTAWRNDSNIITVRDPAWNAWLRLRRRGVGSGWRLARSTGRIEGAPLAQRASEEKGGADIAPRRGSSSPAITIPVPRGGWRA